MKTRAKFQPIINKKKDHLISSRDKTCAKLSGLNSTLKLRMTRRTECFSILSQCLSIPDSIKTLLLQ